MALGIFLVTGLPSNLGAAGAGTAGADITLDTSDARMMALGGTAGSSLDDTAGIEVNPAVLAEQRHYEPGFIHRFSWVGISI
ncbi:MAG: hypothetical protein IH933_10595, partial [Euryarchaeota archaeon]|nr:hypothetical protein [Euryarchaeota archaeon]